jgi:hypothetical protein
MLHTSTSAPDAPHTSMFNASTSVPDAAAPEPWTAACPGRAADVRIYPLGDEALVYLPTAGTGCALNRTALAIFELCDGQRTVAGIGQELAQTLGCAPDALLADVRNGVSELRRAGLVSYG